MSNNTQLKSGERFSDFVRAPGTHAAVTVLIADVCALSTESQGLVLVGLIAVAGGAIAYLIGRLLQDRLRLPLRRLGGGRRYPAPQA